MMWTKLTCESLRHFERCLHQCRRRRWEEEGPRHEGAGPPCDGEGPGSGSESRGLSFPSYSGRWRQSGMK